jgi:hypothetical protein
VQEDEKREEVGYHTLTPLLEGNEQVSTLLKLIREGQDLRAEPVARTWGCVVGAACLCGMVQAEEIEVIRIEVRRSISASLSSLRVVRKRSSFAVSLLLMVDWACWKGQSDLLA